MNNLRVFQLIGLLLGWFALIAQFILLFQNRVTSEVETVIRFFSYFTILSNLLATLSFTALFLNSIHFFRSFKIQTAITVYITIVAVVYNLVLRFIWQPSGLQQIVDELLHVIIPILYVINWFMIKERIRLSYHFIFKILLFPLIYLIFIIIRGNFSNYYPYPFIDVSIIGYKQMLLNSFLVLIAFVVVSFIYLYINKRKR